MWRKTQICTSAPILSHIHACGTETLAMLVCAVGTGLIFSEEVSEGMQAFACKRVLTHVRSSRHMGTKLLVLFFASDQDHSTFLGL